MKKKSEGIRRLSIFLGGLGSSAWFIFVLIATEFFSEWSKQRAMDWIIIIIGLIVSYLIPVTLTRAIHWVVVGFKKDQHNKN